MTGLPSVSRVRPQDSHARSRARGRNARPSIRIVDPAPLQDLTAQAVAGAAHLFPPKPAVQWSEASPRGNAEGHGTFEVELTYGAALTYRLAAPAPDGVLADHH